MSKHKTPECNIYRKKPVVNCRNIPTLNADGSENLDTKPLVTGLRPLTMIERINALTRLGPSALVYGVFDDSDDEDDFQDHLDDVPVEGMSMHEIREDNFVKQQRQTARRRARGKPEKEGGAGALPGEQPLPLPQAKPEDPAKPLPKKEA